MISKGSLLLVVLIFFSKMGYSREVIYGKSRETIAVSFGVETLFRFPMEVKTITEASRFEIKPANTESPDYSVLVVKPRMSEGSADVAFVLSDGSIIRIRLVISNGIPKYRKTDSIYDFKPKDELLDSNPNLLEKREPLVVSELDLMRAMIGGEQISGFEISNSAQKIENYSPDLTIQLIKVYQGSHINGFVYLIRTRSKDQKFAIHLESLAIGRPNLAVLAQVDQPVIGGSSEEDRETLLRVVAKPGASFQKIILPQAILNEGQL